ncbi:MAG: HAMP domain-containing sensor histidine kinase [Anaerovoracaceae bacterium]
MKKNNGVFTLILSNYIIFTLVILLAITGVYVISTYIFFQRDKVEKVVELDDYIVYLENGEYDKIPVDSLLGDKGHFHIIDKWGKYVYSSNNKEYKKFDRSYLPYIINYDEVVQSWNIFSGKYNQYVESIFIIPRLEENEKNAESIILDKDKKVLFSTGRVKDDKLNDAQYKLITSEEKDGYVLRKCDFTNNGEKLHAIIYVEKKNVTAFGRFITPFSTGVLCVLFLYFILIVIFAAHIRKKVAGPIGRLNNSIEDFKENQMTQKVNYRGIKELENICDSFDGLTASVIETRKKEKRMAEGRKKLVADISHDLKTPITVIQGYSEALYKGLVKEEERDLYLKIIHEKSLSLTGLINTLFEYSSYEHADYKMEVTKIDVCELVREYLASRYSEINYKGFQLDIDIPETEIYIEGNKRELSRVFENIITNTFKYSKTGNKILFRIVELDNRVIISTGDNGAGIPEKLKDTIFEPFYRGDDFQKEGSGIGLAVCKRIVELHKGNIWIENSDENGYKTLFNISLNKVK